MTPKVLTPKEIVRDYAESFFDDEFAVSEEERVEKAAFFVKNLCANITQNEIAINIFNSANWHNSGYAATEIANDAGHLSDRLCDDDSRILYTNMRNWLVIFLVAFLRKSRAKNGYRYDLEGYLKGMLLDTIGKIGLGRSPTIAYRVKALLYDAIGYSFKIRQK